MILIQILIATLAVSLVSFVGALALVFSKKGLDKMLLVLVALSGGGLLGGAFLHLIPESIEKIGHEAGQLQYVFLFVIFGFLLFLLIEQFLHWHHCHGEGEELEHCVREEAHKKPVSALILFGDGVHNLIDGLIIAASFTAGPGIGLITTIAVALHEIPQEIGDFGVLVYSGYERKKALLFNFASGLTAMLGGVIGYYFAEVSGKAVLYLLPVAAGGFIYIAASDLVPEIKHGVKASRIALNFSVFLAGILFMFLMKLLPLAG